MSADRLQGPTVQAIGDGDSDIATHAVERRTRDPDKPPPLYGLFDRRISGETRAIAEFSDVTDAQAALAALLRQGCDAWLEIIPLPIP